MVNSGLPQCLLDLRPSRAGGVAAWFAEARAHRLIGGGELKEQFTLRLSVARDNDLLARIAEMSASDALTRPLGIRPADSLFLNRWH